MGNNAVGGVGNHGSGMDSVSNHGSGVDSVGNNGSVDGVGNDGSVDSVGNNGSSVDSVGNDGGSGNVASSRGRGVLGLTRVGDLSNVAGEVVGVVGDGLDPAVGKVDGVRSSHGTGAIVGLGLLEVGLGVVIGHGVGVGVGGGLSEVGGSDGVHHRGVLGGSGGGGHKGKGDEGLELTNEGSVFFIFSRNDIFDNTFMTNIKIVLLYIFLFNLRNIFPH